MTQQVRSVQLEEELKKLHDLVEGIKATVIVNIDGLLVAAYPAEDDVDNPHINPTSSPQVAAMAATLIGLAEKTLGRLSQGDLERLLMEGEEGTMVVYPAGRASVAVLVSKTAHMGHVLFATRQAAGEVERILGG
ncbi:MAG: roadblock/LC7 domain-containing protein [Aggregatilineales bacterium]